MNIIDFATHVDQSGQRFYQEMASRVQHEGLKSIFSSLASDERRLLSRIGEFARDAEYSRYESDALNESENVFDHLISQEDHLHVRDDVNACQLALEAERKVVDVYAKAIHLETQPDARRLLRKIVAEEQGELEEIEKLYNFINAPNEHLEWGEFSNLGEFHNFGRDVDV